MTARMETPPDYAVELARVIRDTFDERRQSGHTGVLRWDVRRRCCILSVEIKMENLLPEYPEF